MRCLPRNIRNSLLSAAVASASLALASCGTTCVAGIFANGTGIVLVKNSTPPPACPFSTGMGTMNVAAIKSQICETCTASSRAQHIFVTLRSIQLHSLFSNSPSSPEWLELAPQLHLEPRKLDMIGDSSPEILVQSAPVPGGAYRELRVQFSPDAPTNADALPAENPCGNNHRHCVVMADGRVEELRFGTNGDAPELLLPLQNDGISELAVVPGATVNLRLTLQLQLVFSASPSEGWQTHYVLVGSASISR
jgi:hypothetical protein